MPTVNTRLGLMWVYEDKLDVCEVCGRDDELWYRSCEVSDPLPTAYYWTWECKWCESVHIHKGFTHLVKVEEKNESR